MIFFNLYTDNTIFWWF